MNSGNTSQILTRTVDKLSETDSLKGLFHEHYDNDPIPSAIVLEEIIGLARSILFPGFYGKSYINTQTLKYHIGVNTERMHCLLEQQILAGLCFTAPIQERENACNCETTKTLKKQARDAATEVTAKMPEIRRVLATDVEAAYNGDPAATSYGEIISCYPVIRALTNYRIAHELVLLGIPLIPRMMTEMAHSETGIDIHPAATIGEYFTIDHGTGVVIGATCIIGNNVKIYQGVTLGAKSFPLDTDGNPIKGIPRHPIIEDDVVIYANATLLGRITIGKGCVVGANAWVTADMRPNTVKNNHNFRKDNTVI